MNVLSTGLPKELFTIFKAYAIINGLWVY